MLRREGGSCSRRWSSLSVDTTTRPSYRGVNNSALQLPARWPTSRRSCLLTSQPETWDSQTGRHVLDVLMRVRASRGTTLVLVTHDPEVAGLADQQLTLRDGRAVEPEVEVA